MYCARFFRDLKFSIYKINKIIQDGSIKLVQLEFPSLYSNRFRSENSKETFEAFVNDEDIFKTVNEAMHEVIKFIFKGYR